MSPSYRKIKAFIKILGWNERVKECLVWICKTFGEGKKLHKTHLEKAGTKIYIDIYLSKCDICISHFVTRILGRDKDNNHIVGGDEYNTIRIRL